MLQIKVDAKTIREFSNIMLTLVQEARVDFKPDGSQKILLEKHFGSCRFVYNHFLSAFSGSIFSPSDVVRKDLIPMSMPIIPLPLCISSSDS